MIRNATEKDIDNIKKIYSNARKFMSENGNPNQWEEGYPSDSIILQDILQKNCYLIQEEGCILGVFVFIIGEEPTYKIIEDGAWRDNERSYGTIHRIASSGNARGIAVKCFDFCAGKVGYLRIDTHRDNKMMQSSIKKYGFKKCGIIHVRNGERIAFDYIV